MFTIKIEQLNSDREAYRTFTQYAATEVHLQSKLTNIQRSYNMDNTRVSVNGHVMPLPNL